MRNHQQVVGEVLRKSLFKKIIHSVLQALPGSERQHLLAQQTVVMSEIFPTGLGIYGISMRRLEAEVPQGMV